MPLVKSSVLFLGVACPHLLSHTYHTAASVGRGWQAVRGAPRDRSQRQACWSLGRQLDGRAARRGALPALADRFPARPWRAPCHLCGECHGSEHGTTPGGGLHCRWHHRGQTSGRAPGGWSVSFALSHLSLPLVVWLGVHGGKVTPLFLPLYTFLHRPLQANDGPDEDGLHQIAGERAGGAFFYSGVCHPCLLLLFKHSPSITQMTVSFADDFGNPIEWKQIMCVPLSSSLSCCRPHLFSLAANRLSCLSDSFFIWAFRSCV